MDTIYQRKTIRLNRKIYQKEGLPFSITICTKDKMSLSDKLKELIFRSALEGDLKKNSDLMAVCIMPDHVHLLLAPTKENLLDLISRWKSYTTHLIQVEEKVGRLWQRSFYDHGLRREEDVTKVAEYIVNNPVRKGLVENAGDYPFSWHKWM